jgi:hypothetical protein
LHRKGYYRPPKKNAHEEFLFVGVK